ncbi:NAD-dependent epimerase/dehydratase family protein [Nitrosopumilus sp.]|nr:NAD-dependent epimerase/dehydratase family protein [Nitrosopumilus sp.]|tara:strand:+ start:51 stop:956 length:906 start_codon:yes stop_codon:yes gene_type:complete
MKYIVTGGAGFIGSRIAKLLVKYGDSVTVIDNLHTGKIENLAEIHSKIDFIKADIRNFEDMEKNIIDCDGIFHEAALTLVQESFTKQKEYNEVNVIGTENIFKIAQKKNIKVVFASSSSVYGNVNEIPISESSIKKPINPYGITKLDDEKLAEKFVKKNLQVIGLRYFNVYGIGQTGSYAGVITKFINRLKENKNLIINGDGNQIRDFIFVDDVARANIKAMKSNVKEGFFNIGTNIGTSINDLANMLIEISQQKINSIHSEQLEGDIKFSQADTKLTKKILEWEFQTHLKQGLEKIYPNF